MTRRHRRRDDRRQCKFVSGECHSAMDPNAFVCVYIKLSLDWCTFPMCVCVCVFWGSGNRAECAIRKLSAMSMSSKRTRYAIWYFMQIVAWWALCVTHVRHHDDGFGPKWCRCARRKVIRGFPGGVSAWGYAKWWFDLVKALTLLVPFKCYNSICVCDTWKKHLTYDYYIYYKCMSKKMISN